VVLGRNQTQNEEEKKVYERGEKEAHEPQR
jgi:hypothetical protein